MDKNRQKTFWSDNCWMLLNISEGLWAVDNLKPKHQEGRRITLKRRLKALGVCLEFEVGSRLSMIHFVILSTLKYQSFASFRDGKVKVSKVKEFG